jgi:hypothetical protein
MSHSGMLRRVNFKQTPMAKHTKSEKMSGAPSSQQKEYNLKAWASVKPPGTPMRSRRNWTTKSCPNLFGTSRKIRFPTTTNAKTKAQ